MKKSTYKLIPYEKNPFKCLGKFIEKNLLLLKSYKNGGEVLVDTTHQPYKVVIRFPIHLSQEKQRLLLKKSNHLFKGMIRDAVLGEDGSLMYRPYGGMTERTERTEKRISKIMNLYWKMKKTNDSPKDYACWTDIAGALKMKAGAVKKIIERNKKSHPDHKMH